MNIFQYIYSSCAIWLIKKIHDNRVSNLRIEYYRDLWGNIIMREIAPKVESMIANVDAASKEVVQISVNNLINELVLSPAPYEFSPFQREHLQLYNAEKRTYKQYKLKPAIYLPEVFYTQHGLRFCNPKIREYIKGKCFLDCGAFIGDSAIVLSKYNPSKILCFEFSKPTIECLKNNLKRNHIENIVEIIPYALSDENTSSVAGTELISGDIAIPSDKSPTTPSTQSSNIIIKKLDDVITSNIEVGFIKADIEGALMPMLKGGVETIARNRPVLSLSIYHNPDELFGTKSFLERFLTDYAFEFHHANFSKRSLSELILFAYPKEIIEI